MAAIGMRRDRKAQSPEGKVSAGAFLFLNKIAEVKKYQW